MSEYHEKHRKIKLKIEKPEKAFWERIFSQDVLVSLVSLAKAAKEGLLALAVQQDLALRTGFRNVLKRPNQRLQEVTRTRFETISFKGDGSRCEQGGSLLNEQKWLIFYEHCGPLFS